MVYSLTKKINHAPRKKKVVGPIFFYPANKFVITENALLSCGTHSGRAISAFFGF